MCKKKDTSTRIKNGKWIFHTWDKDDPRKGKCKWANYECDRDATSGDGGTTCQFHKSYRGKLLEIPLEAFNKEKTDKYHDITHCEICDVKFNKVITRQVDHCHTDNFIRGIICRGCNSQLGAIEWYLKAYNEIQEIDKSKYVKQLLKYLKNAKINF